jgi:hypothetical protein
MKFSIYFQITLIVREEHSASGNRRFDKERLQRR